MHQRSIIFAFFVGFIFSMGGLVLTAVDDVGWSMSILGVAILLLSLHTLIRSKIEFSREFTEQASMVPVPALNNEELPKG